MADRIIKEDVLRGIVGALDVFAPELLPVIQKIMRGGTPEAAAETAGASIYHKLNTMVSWDEGEPILLALEAIERKLGCSAVFEGRQINFLVMSWRSFIESNRLSP